MSSSGANASSRSTLEIGDIPTERLRRGPAIIKTDAHGREIYSPDGEVLTKFLMSDNKVDIVQGPIGSGKTERDVPAAGPPCDAASAELARRTAADAMGHRPLHLSRAEANNDPDMAARMARKPLWRS